MSSGRRARRTSTRSAVPQSSHLFLGDAFHLKTQCKLTEDRHGNGVRHLGGVTVPAGDVDLLVPESYGNWNDGKKRKTGIDLRK